VKLGTAFTLSLSFLLTYFFVTLGAQTCFYENKGAFTGAVSGPMLASVGCTYTLVGHSERRKIFNEVDGDLNHIVEKVLNSHLLTNLITYLLTHSLANLGSRVWNRSHFMRWRIKRRI
jgi:hypothetical protein